MVYQQTISRKARKAYAALKGQYSLATSGRYDRYLRLMLLFSIAVFVSSITIVTLKYFNALTYLSSLSISDQYLHDLFGSDGYVSYLVVFILSPIPDYLLLPIAGYLSFLGIFNPWAIYIVSTVSMTLFMQAIYYSTRIGGRPLLVKFLKYFRISEKRLEGSDMWIQKHGAMSVFAFTFVPYLTIAMSLASGLFNMNVWKFFLANLAGFAIRYALLIDLGFQGVGLFGRFLGGGYTSYYILLIMLTGFYLIIYLMHITRETSRHQEEKQAN